jgi:hypothetical protein
MTILSNTFQLSGDIKKLSGKAPIAILCRNECLWAASLIGKAATSEKSKIIALYDATQTSLITHFELASGWKAVFPVLLFFFRLPC